MEARPIPARRRSPIYPDCPTSTSWGPITWVPKVTPRHRTVDLGIRLNNAGLLNLSTCGQAPIFGKAVTPTYTVGPPKRVTLAWGPAFDETGGEKDIERYIIYRRTSTATTFGEPYASIPSGLAAYSFTRFPSELR